jgi:hypothetical protein
VSLFLYAAGKLRENRGMFPRRRLPFSLGFLSALGAHTFRCWFPTPLRVGLVVVWLTAPVGAALDWTHSHAERGGAVAKRCEGSSARGVPHAVRRPHAAHVWLRA